MTAPEGGRAGTFRARIYRIGILRCVDVPTEVGSELAGWRHPPVHARVDGEDLRTHLTPAGKRVFRLYLDGELRAAIGADTGDEVAVSVRLDETLQAEPFPDDLLDLADRLEHGPLVLRTLPPGLKRQILKSLSAARSESTRRKRLERIADLLEERSRKLHGAESS